MIRGGGREGEDEGRRGQGEGVGGGSKGMKVPEGARLPSALLFLLRINIAHFSLFILL